MMATLHRKCGCGGTCNACAETAKGAQAVPPIVHDVLRSPGRPLDNATRAVMEPRFGRDFSDVRVHSGDREAASAQSVGALAYASGRHIVLGETRVAPHVLAHELAHVAQNDGNAMPERISDPSSAQEREATRAESGAAVATPAAGGTLHRYRDKSAFNFGVADTSTLKEAEFKDSKKQPWVETIDIKFTGTATANSETIPTGKLTATYFANPAALSDITASITGGTPSLGLTDKVTGEKIKRIEGVGYNDVPLGSGGEGPNKKYAKPDASGSRNASMHFALFFFGKEAIHVGSLTDGSHACVHTPITPMQQLNYHSVERRTVVNVSYDTAALTTPCCERGKTIGATKKGEIPNPCNNVDPKTCGGKKP